MLVLGIQRGKCELYYGPLSARDSLWCFVDDLLQRSAVELATLVRARAVSSVDLVETRLRRVEAVNSELSAVVQFAPDALERARAADAAAARGAQAPLLGVPAAPSDGLPVGVQIAARAWEDHVAIALAIALEEAARSS